MPPQLHLRSRPVLPWALILLFVLAVLPAVSENLQAKTVSRARATKTESPVKSPKPKTLAGQKSIKLADGSIVTVSEIIPRVEASQKQLQQILDAVGSSDVDSLVTSLNELNGMIGDSRPSTERLIKIARSPLQLTEPSISWARFLADMETLNTAAGLDATNLMKLRLQARDQSESLARWPVQPARRSFLQN